MNRALPTFALLAALICGGLARAADADDTGEPVRSSARDYSINAERNAPIVCKDGEIAPFRGKTMADVFGDAWPEQEAPHSPNAHLRPQVLSRGRITPPRGLQSQSGVVVMAFLVDTTGRPARTEAICMTSPGFVTAAKRAAKTARFEPAVVNGKPVASVLVVPYMFRPSHRATREGTAD